MNNFSFIFNFPFFIFHYERFIIYQSLQKAADRKNARVDYAAGGQIFARIPRDS